MFKPGDKALHFGTVVTILAGPVKDEAGSDVYWVRGKDFDSIFASVLKPIPKPVCDRNGQPLAVGDEVWVKGVVDEIQHDALPLRIRFGSNYCQVWRGSSEVTKAAPIASEYIPKVGDRVEWCAVGANPHAPSTQWLAGEVVNVMDHMMAHVVFAEMKFGGDTYGSYRFLPWDRIRPVKGGES